MDYQIREMNKNDWDSVLNIYQEGLASDIATFNTEAPTYDEWDKAHLKDLRYVILVNNQVKGWIALSPTSSRYVYRGVCEVSIYITNDAKGKGLGTALFNYLIKESENKGIWTLYSSIIDLNKASINLHLKCGFRIVGYREKIAQNRYHQWLNTIIMERRSKIIE
ncbi:MAG: GNAT family N-acetyltransferase [Bacilli bacterium]|jgi:phosphinothricin acetyltransferase|nr:GNAT family N-acetyltransferase [Bacilli bacterium]